MRLISGRVSGSGTIAVPVCSSEAGAQFEGKALNLLVKLHYFPDVWSRVMGSGQKNQVTNTGDEKKSFCPKGV